MVSINLTAMCSLQSLISVRLKKPAELPRLNISRIKRFLKVTAESLVNKTLQKTLNLLKTFLYRLFLI